jgi:hypothetical protein
LNDRILIAESRCAVFFVSPVSPEILKPGSPLQRVHPVSVDRAREHADPTPTWTRPPVSRGHGFSPPRGVGGHVFFGPIFEPSQRQIRSGKLWRPRSSLCGPRHQHCKYDRNENERRHISDQMTALGRIGKGLNAHDRPVNHTRPHGEPDEALVSVGIS